MRIGLTGHQKLSEPSGWVWVRQWLDTFLPSVPKPLVGITCLAVGADQLFAEAIFRSLGTIEAVIPFPDYETTFDEEDKQLYRQFLGRASKVILLAKQSSEEESYLNAGKVVVGLSDLVVAVWDGKPAAGLGGTADIVEYARNQMKQVVWLNPVLGRIM